MPRFLLFSLLSLSLLLASLQVSAEDAAEGEAAGPTVQYIEFEPSFVVNYGSTGRMKYLRTDVALRVNNTEAAAKVSMHKPYIQHNLVMLFSAQEPDIMTTSAGHEKLRKLALKSVQDLMTELEGEPCVDDLYFKNLVVQN